MNTHRPLSIIIALAATLLGGAGSAGARPLWRPQVTVRPALDTPPAHPGLDEKTRQRFDRLYGQGMRLLKDGQYRKAQPLLEKAISLNPDQVEVRRAHARTLLTLGYLHWNRALVERALADIRHARWLRPQDIGLRQLSDLLRGLRGRMDRAAGKQKKTARLTR